MPSADEEGYEERAFLTGKIATRPGNTHDLFNALIWLAFPRTKEEQGHWGRFSPWARRMPRANGKVIAPPLAAHSKAPRTAHSHVECVPSGRFGFPPNGIYSPKEKALPDALA